MVNQIEKKEAITLMKTFFKLMSIISSLDELSESTLFKHELKKDTNKYLKTIERALKPLLSSMDVKELDAYTEIVNSIDEFINEIEIEY
jgi:hypothetical protein